MESNFGIDPDVLFPDKSTGIGLVTGLGQTRSDHALIHTIFRRNILLAIHG